MLGAGWTPREILLNEGLPIDGSTPSAFPEACPPSITYKGHTSASRVRLLVVCAESQGPTPQW